MIHPGPRRRGAVVAAVALMVLGPNAAFGTEDASAPADEMVVITEIMQNDDDSDFHIAEGSLAIPGGGYVVIGRNGDTASNGGVAVDYVTGSAILLHNNFDELTLLDPNGVRADRVVWDDGRTFPDPTGASKKNKRCPDIVIIDDFNFELRAERNGWEDGRVYTITYEITTSCGGTGLYSTTVTVPHDQGHRGF